MIFFGTDLYRRELKKAAKTARVDRTDFKRWLRQYDRIRKNIPQITNHYHQIRNDAQQVLGYARELEQILIQTLLEPEELLQKQDGLRVKEIVEELKKIQPNLDFHFLIGKEDKEIHMTLSGLINNGPEFISGRMDSLLMQSEVENLISMIYESLEKEKPNLFELASFYVNHTDAELLELSHSMQLELVHELFVKEFTKPVLPVIGALMQGKGYTEDVLEEKTKDYLHRLTSI